MNILNTDTIKMRVLKGATLLDSVCPGWEQRIDIEKLSASHSAGNITQQLFGVADNFDIIALLTAGTGIKLNTPTPRDAGSDAAWEWLCEHGFAAWKYGIGGTHKEIIMAWIELILVRAIASLE